ncbi:hypothetical protein BH09PSE6_BH09PSE6_30870 [soil metagenome]
MTSGTRSADRARRAVAVALLLGLTAGTVRAAAPFDLGALMTELSAIKAGKARFVERKTLSVLDRPLESTGELACAAPDRFTRRTSTPRAESVEVVGDQLTFTSGGKTRTASLSNVPEAAGIIDALRGTLTGDQARLERVFTVKLSGTREQWWIDLVPRDARLSATVLSIRISGAAARIRTVDVFGPDNDRTTTTLEPVQ